MSLKCVMGFDHGSKRIGVAVGQTLTATARPLTTIRVKNQQLNWETITSLIQEWQPEILIVGWPQHADGSESSSTVAARYFAQQLQERYHLPVHTIDETLSSVAAAEQISSRRPLTKRGNQHPTLRNRSVLSNKPSPFTKAKNDLDAVAAQIILETWFAECL